MVKAKSKKLISMEVNIPVAFMREGKMFVAYSPVLDLSTCGDTFKKAQQNFDEAVALFFEELIEKDALEDVLLSLGWRKVHNELKPPIFVGQNITKMMIPAHA